MKPGFGNNRVDEPCRPVMWAVRMAVVTIYLVLSVTSVFAQSTLMTKSLATLLTNPAAESVNRLQDVQIGENGRVTRIAIFCRSGCSVSRVTNGFRLADINDSLTIDLAPLSKNAEMLIMKAVTDEVSAGSLLKVTSQKVLLRSSVNDCELGGVSATCIDLEYSQQPYQRQLLAKQSQSTANSGVKGANLKQDHLSKVPSDEFKAKQKEEPVAVSLSAPADLHAPQKLALRNADELENSDVVTATNVNLSGAARVATSSAIVSLTDVPVGSASLPGRSVLRPAETKLVLGRVDFREQAETILGRQFDSETCEVAKARLAADAWALDAMGLIGFCHGVRGDYEEAETIFRRLNTQEPKNTDALIGRALIAAITGEKSIALKFFNDALDARPSNEVSARISETIAIY